MNDLKEVRAAAEPGRTGLARWKFSSRTTQRLGRSALAACLGAAILVVSPLLSAKEDRRGPTWIWTLWGGDGGEFDSAGAVIDAWNEASSAAYDACIAKNCASCSKHIYHGTSKVGPIPSIVNGELNSRGTGPGTFTTYTAACTVDYGNGNVVTYPAQGPTVDESSGGIAAVAAQRCLYGYGAGGKGLGQVTIDGVQVSVSEKYCVKEVPEPCRNGCPQYGNPIDAVAGSKLASELDYAGSIPGLEIRRNYSSTAGRWAWSFDPGLADFTGATPSSKGATALYGFVMQVPGGYYTSANPPPPAVPVAKSFALMPSNADEPNKEVAITTGQRRIVFRDAGGGTFETSDPSRPSLTLQGSGSSALWIVRLPAEGFEVFDGTGALVRRVSRTGDAISVVRAVGQMTVTQASSGRQLAFARTSATSPPTVYDRVTLPDGSLVTYDIDAAGLVKAVVFPDGSRKEYVYGEAANTGTTAPVSWLTGMVDENGARYATYRYNGQAPISTEHAGGVGRYEIALNSDYQYSTVASPAMTSGQSLTLWWNRAPDGERRVTRRAQPAGSGSSSATQVFEYDAAGNISGLDNYNDTRTCYTHDMARGNEIVVVDGLARGASCTVTSDNASLPAGSRKTSKQWHPDWRLEAKVAEPGRITTSVYNGQPDPFNGNAIASCAPTTALLPDGKPIAVLCKRVEQATTDANGAAGFSATLQAGVVARTWKWTYNEYGQVLTEDGPRTDVTDVTTYTYYTDTTADHTKGDLQQVTNAVGKVTQYTKYNKHGQVLERVDPNGVRTVNTYDLRQRLLSTTVGGQATSYTYDPVGQLKRVTLPDASYVGYDYDDAHRLVAVYDHLGNRTTYELDNAGNRTSEKTTDPTNQLKRQLGRSIDALGRIQQTTGRE